MARIKILEAAVMALMEGSLDTALRREAFVEAHELAGALAVGFARGAHLAKAVEHLLGSREALGEAQALRLSELVVDLRSEVERSPGQQSSAEAMAPREAPPTLLLINDDRGLAEQLTREATARGIRVEAVAESAAWDAISRVRPDVVLLELTLTSSAEGRVALLSRLASHNPPIPTIVLAGEFVDRVEVAKLGARGVLQKPMTPSEIVGFVVDLLDRLRAPQARILAVDNDAKMLVTLRMFLEPKGIQMTILENPARFWEALELTHPDLLVLDLDMPQVSGIEICRMIRKEARWRGLPLLLLSASADADAGHRAFAAGADDFVHKPVAGPELVTRVLNRLERVQSVRSTTEMDALTGLATEQRLALALRQYVKLSDRYRQPLTLGLLEVDDFDGLVGRHGRAATDAILRHVSEILVRSLRGEDVITHGEGAEFALGMFGMNKNDGVRRLTEVLDAIRQEAFVALSGGRFHVTATVGISEYPMDGEDWPTLRKMARRAVDQGRAGGGGAVLPAGGKLYRGEGGQRVDVVLVDDDEAVATLLLQALETRGYRTRWLRDGQTAVEMLGGASPLVRTQVVLLDVGLPELDGLSVLRRLGEDGVTRHARVIMLTARWKSRRCWRRSRRAPSTTSPSHSAFRCCCSGSVARWSRSRCDDLLSLLAPRHHR
jgi:diguanylate cyclase (GGDEF)-like protein